MVKVGRWMPFLRAKQLGIAMRGLLVFLLLCSGYSRPPEAPVKGAENSELMQDGPNASAVSLEDLRRGAEGGRAASQRELAGRLRAGPQTAVGSA